jgi:hypothetical protein
MPTYKLRITTYKKKTSTYECRTTTTCERKNNNLLSLALALSLSRSLFLGSLSLSLFLDSLSLFSAPNFRVRGDLLKKFYRTIAQEVSKYSPFTNYESKNKNYKSKTTTYK